MRRFTLGGTAQGPVWSPDGKRIAYAGGENHFYVRDVDGETKADLLWANEHWGGPVSWSPDGRYVTLWSFDPKTATGYDAFMLPLFGERQLIPLANTTASEFPSTFSPDGRWLCYNSDQSGRHEVYAVSFPDLQRRQQISVRGGDQSTWAGPREIWYHQPDGTWVSVTLVEREGVSLEVSDARPLFRDQQIISLEVSAEGDRLLGVREIGDDEQAQIVLVSGWKRLLDSQRR